MENSVPIAETLASFSEKWFQGLATKTPGHGDEQEIKRWVLCGKKMGSRNDRNGKAHLKLTNTFVPFCSFSRFSGQVVVHYKRPQRPQTLRFSE